MKRQQDSAHRLAADQPPDHTSGDENIFRSEPHVHTPPIASDDVRIFKKGLKDRLSTGTVLSGKRGRIMSTINSKTTKLAQLAVLVAITIIMGITPLGTIRTPILSVSIVTVPVAIAAILLGTTGGLVTGAVFGLTSFINAVTGTSGMMSILLQINPFGAVVTTIVARILVGLCTALIFKGFHKIQPLRKPSYYIASVCAPLLNTLFFMTSLVVFFYHTDYIQGMVEKLGVSNPIAFVIALVGVQGLIEAGAALVLAGTISIVLARYLRKV